MRTFVFVTCAWCAPTLFGPMGAAATGGAAFTPAVPWQPVQFVDCTWPSMCVSLAPPVIPVSA